MTESVIVARVLEAKTHPDTDLQHLSVLNVDGKTAIAGKMEDGSHRYPEGSLVVFLPVDTVIPLDLLQKQGFYWDAAKGRGLLKGNKLQDEVAVAMRDEYLYNTVMETPGNIVITYGSGHYSGFRKLMGKGWKVKSYKMAPH